MAEVYLCRDIRLGRDVAVKVLRADLARDPSFHKRFRREAQAVAGLNHPAIVSVYDTGEDPEPDGSVTPFIVMEYVQGRTLREVLKTEGHLTAERAMEITAEVCSALDFSHRSGIVHRDIKPGNVMITNDGGIKVMDFGIARALADSAATVTSASAVIGTAQYLSPEQARGESVDARSDVYSTGCLLYELITGHPPFTGDSPVAVAYQHVRENALVPSSVNKVVPRSLDSIVMKSLAKNPLNRYQTAAEMRADLHRAIGGTAVAAESVMTDAERTQIISAVPGTAPKTGLLGSDDDEDEDGRRGKGAVIWAVVVVALLAVIGTAAYALVHSTNKPDGPKSVTMANLVGLVPAVAEQKIRDAHLTVVPAHPGTNGPCAIPRVTKGKVCTQSPLPDVQVPENGEVSFTVYAGPANVQVPQVVGTSFEEAQRQLSAAGMRAVRKDVVSAQPEGRVTSQNPLAFTAVQPGTSVTVEVSSGKLKVPSGLLYLTKQEAHDKLNVAGFLNLAYVDAEVHDGFKVGDVMAVDPASGSTVDPKTKITLTIGIAKPTPTCTPTTPAATPTTSAPSSPVVPGATPTVTAPTTPSVGPSC
jgi:serine/threonine-protein kinase